MPPASSSAGKTTTGGQKVNSQRSASQPEFASQTSDTATTKGSGGATGKGKTREIDQLPEESEEEISSKKAKKTSAGRKRKKQNEDADSSDEDHEEMSKKKKQKKKGKGRKKSNEEDEEDEDDGGDDDDEEEEEEYGVDEFDMEEEENGGFDMDRLGDDVGIPGASTEGENEDDLTANQGQRMVLQGGTGGGLSTSLANAKLASAGLLGKDEEQKGALMDFLKGDTDTKWLLLMNSIMDLQDANKRLMGLLKENWKMSPAIQKYIGDLCRVVLLCGMYKSKLNVSQWHGKIIGPVLAHLRRAKDFPPEWWKDVEINKKVKKVCRDKINEAKKRLAEILNAPGADKLGIDKIVAEWIPFKISHRLAYVAAFYVSVIRNTEKDPKTSKVQAKDGWANAMKGLVELQKDYTERLKGKKDEDYSAEQTAFFDEFIRDYYTELTKKVPLEKEFDWSAVIQTLSLSVTNAALELTLVRGKKSQITNNSNSRNTSLLNIIN